MRIDAPYNPLPPLPHASGQGNCICKKFLCPLLPADFGGEKVPEGRMRGGASTHSTSCGTRGQAPLIRRCAPPSPRTSCREKGNSRACRQMRLPHAFGREGRGEGAVPRARNFEVSLCRHRPLTLPSPPLARWRGGTKLNAITLLAAGLSSRSNTAHSPAGERRK